MTPDLSPLDIGLGGALMFFCFIGWPLLVLAWFAEKRKSVCDHGVPLDEHCEDCAEWNGWNKN